MHSTKNLNLICMAETGSDCLKDGAVSDIQHKKHYTLTNPVGKKN